MSKAESMAARKDEVMKRKRKIRKTLRQIEHLKLLLRPLNEEEEDKMWREETLREELAALNLECNDEDEDYGEEAYEAITHTVEPVVHLGKEDQDADKPLPVYRIDNVEPTVQQPTQDDEDKMIEVAAAFEEKMTMQPTKQTETKEEEEEASIPASEPAETVKTQPKEVVTESAPTAVKSSKKKKSDNKQTDKQPSEAAATTTKPEQKQQQQQQPPATQPSVPVKPKQQSAPPSLPPKASISIDVNEIAQAHEDLIVSIDVDVEHGLIVTGR
jgi:hypothetical protein